MQPVTLSLDGFGGQSHASARSDPKERAAGTQRLHSWTGNHHIQICKKIVYTQQQRASTLKISLSKKHKNAFCVNVRGVQVHSKIYVEFVHYI